jgi:hypothetical protein
MMVAALLCIYRFSQLMISINYIKVEVDESCQAVQTVFGATP